MKIFLDWEACIPFLHWSILLIGQWKSSDNVMDHLYTALQHWCIQYGFFCFYHGGGLRQKNCEISWNLFNPFSYLTSNCSILYILSNTWLYFDPLRQWHFLIVAFFPWLLLWFFHLSEQKSSWLSWDKQWTSTPLSLKGSLNLLGSLSSFWSPVGYELFL